MKSSKFIRSQAWKSVPNSKAAVVVFSGGSGTKDFTKKLISNSRVDLTLVVNGYDDGLSTGEIRKLLGDCLGPSDFRKNATRLATELGTCSISLIKLFELRIPENYKSKDGLKCLTLLKGASVMPTDAFQTNLLSCMNNLDGTTVECIKRKINCFENLINGSSQAFKFADCSIGNIIYAGCYLDKDRHFNNALVDFCNILHLPTGILENITDGTDAYLVALDRGGKILASEAEIVDGTQQNQIEDIFLLNHRLSKEEKRRLSLTTSENILKYFSNSCKIPRANSRVINKIVNADLIVYSPGTQYSSLFPSYMTPGIGEAIAANLRAFKILITNLQDDADLADTNAVEILNRAVYYLREKNSKTMPTPCLITHYLINDPGHGNDKETYIPVGMVETLEDPRLVRIGNYEDALTGHHDPEKVLYPFINSLLEIESKPKVAILLLETDSKDKICQTMLEMIRAGILESGISATIFFQCYEDFECSFEEALPFRIYNLWNPRLRSGLLSDIKENYDYIAFFESTGMYRGADIVSLVSFLNTGKLDAVWGSRRLSLSDIKHAYKLLHRETPIRGAISYMGSHILSLAYLLLYGYYINDSLSGIRVIRAKFLFQGDLDPSTRGLNHKLLGLLLRNHGEIIETPVHYFPIAPKKVKRTTIAEGFLALWTIFWYRFKRQKHRVQSSTKSQRLFWRLPKAKIKVHEL